jgi:mRNA interferase MazF
MRFGKMYNSGSVVIAKVQFTDTFEIKKRPVLVLFEDYGNIIVAGITSNINMKGILLSKKEGMIKDSVIKTNYIFTISEKMIYKHLFNLNLNKRKQVYDELISKLNQIVK